MSTSRALRAVSPAALIWAAEGENFGRGGTGQGRAESSLPAASCAMRAASMSPAAAAVRTASSKDASSARRGLAAGAPGLAPGAPSPEVVASLGPASPRASHAPAAPSCPSTPPITNPASSLLVAPPRFELGRPLGPKILKAGQGDPAAANSDDRRGSGDGSSPFEEVSGVSAPPSGDSKPAAATVPPERGVTVYMDKQDPVSASSGGPDGFGHRGTRAELVAALLKVQLTAAQMGDVEAARVLHEAVGRLLG